MIGEGEMLVNGSVAKVLMIFWHADHRLEERRRYHGRFDTMRIVLHFRIDIADTQMLNM